MLFSLQRSVLKVKTPYEQEGEEPDCSALPCVILTNAQSLQPIAVLLASSSAQWQSPWATAYGDRRGYTGSGQDTVP